MYIHLQASPLPPKGLSLTAKAGPLRQGEAASEGYSSTPRSSAAQRHVGLAQDAATPAEAAQLYA